MGIETLRGGRVGLGEKVEQASETKARERNEPETLARDLAAALEEIKTLRGAHAALSAKVESAQASEKKTQALQDALDRERKSADALSRDLAEVRDHMETLRGGYAALAAKAKVAQASEANAKALQDALDGERNSAERLARELAAARGEIETLRGANSAKAEIANTSETKAQALQDALDRQRLDAELWHASSQRLVGRWRSSEALMLL